MQPMIDASNRAGKSPVVTVYKRKRKNSGSDSISPGPYPYQMSGHYTPPYIPEHYGTMYPPYHNDVTVPPPHYSSSTYGCRSDQHQMTPMPSTSCSQMRHPSYGSYRPTPSPTPQSYFGHSHPSSMMTSQNLHGYHPTHPQPIQGYAPPPPHSYQQHDNLQHGVMDMHSS